MWSGEKTNLLQICIFRKTDFKSPFTDKDAIFFFSILLLILNPILEMEVSEIVLFVKCDKTESKAGMNSACLYASFSEVVSRI